MGACARMLRNTRYRKQQTKHHRHPNYRHHLVAHHADWITPPTSLWSRHFRSGTTFVETGGNLGVNSGSSFADTFPVSKGVIWLLIATAAEVTPVVCPGFVATLHFSSLQYVTGVYFLGFKRYFVSSARSVDYELALNSIPLQTQTHLTLYVYHLTTLSNSLLTSFPNDTDVPNSRDDHNVHRCNTDASLSGKLCI